MTLSPLGASATPPAEAPTLAPLPAGWPAKYPRFRNEEIGLTLALLAGLTATTLLVPTPPEGFRGEWAGDRLVRDAVRLEDPDAQERVAKVSDVIQNTTLLVPLVVDLGIGAILLEGDLDLALQMALVDAEALVAVASLIQLTKRTVGRVRPNVPSCADGGYACRSNSSRRAFVSGHTAAAFTAAGLSCAHHQNLRLFGGIGDDLVCAGMLALAGTAGTLRVVADKHWLTDTLAGGAVGLLSGYVMPYLLHYQGPVTWPGLGDGELDGSLSLSLLGGVNWGVGAAQIATGVEASARQLVHVARPIRLELGARGRLLYDLEGQGVRDLEGQARTWFGPLGLGLAARYRAVHQAGPDTTRGALGASLAFGTFDEAHPWLVSLSWLPVGPPENHLSGRIEWAPWRHVVAHLDVRPHRASADAQTVQGASVTLGLGGRLPW